LIDTKSFFFKKKKIENREIRGVREERNHGH
jgi:hypothetical protein